MRRGRLLICGLMTAVLLMAPLSAAGAWATTSAGPVVAALESTGDVRSEVAPSRSTTTGRVGPASDGGFIMYADGWSFELHPPEGRRIAAGVYPDASSLGGRPHGAWADLSVGLQDVGFGGVVDVLDWSAPATGLPTRFDIVFRSGGIGAQSWFGELRMGEDSAGTPLLTARHLAWLPTPVGSVPLGAVEGIRNPSGRPVRVGRAALTGDAAKDWKVSADGCSGRTLAPGGACTLHVSFAPRTAGQRIGELRVPVDGRIATASLAGSTPLGRTSFTTSGDDGIDAGGTRTWTEGGTTAFASWRSGCGREIGNIDLGDLGQPADSFILTLGAPDGTDPEVGTHPTEGCTTQGYSLNVAERGTQFGGPVGTEDVRRLDVDRFGDITAADVAFTLTEEAGRPMNGRLLVQVRSDYTAPDAPTRVRVSGGSTRTAHWSRSDSPDAVRTIVRLVAAAADPAALTPITGYPVTAGSGASVRFTLPRRGAAYRLVLFAVDRAGNVSAPALAAIPAA